MNNFYPYILSITSTLNEWNEKLNNLISKYGDSAWIGALVVGLVFIITAWGINTLNKK